jgi:hypothetical protein
MDDIRIKFELGDIERCRAFAEESYQTSIDYYEERGQSDRFRIFHQTREGKMGEFLVYRYLRSRGFILEEPDTKTYKKGEKSWKPDLFFPSGSCGTLQIAVKSQTLEMQRVFTASFLFGYADRGGNQSQSHTDELFKLEHQDVLIVPVTVSEDNGGGVIRAAVLARDVMPEIEKSLPHKKELQNSKRVLYGDYLKTLSDEIRWRWPFNQRD